ncbi:coiled-coil domain-containing protein [Kosakonia sacchari]|uniref:Large ATP-binding protein n=1 Tax=Kosakonia sacchari TaxID=1158459 RepID=A0A1G4Y354_9ENTR|nr:hypothetical protein [Kosakonia sacchari]AHJ76777.1 large ATP-binding protein [Kosakonia sacchari SP1]SCX47885.1 hypothetical protein SAMN02927897_01911 [Kosakonia sacchari]
MTNANKEWLQVIAAKVGAHASEIQAVLTSHRIQPTPVLGTPRRMYIREIEFSGVKSGITNAGAFCFSWKDLDHGLWAMLSEQNFRGKSTIIEITRWMLRGNKPSTLQDDVSSWIHKARLRFVLDTDIFEVEVSTSEQVIGSLSRLRAGSEAMPLEKTILAKFEGVTQFESVMANFFMQAFSLDTIATWRKYGSGEGTPVAHGWAALSGAMFIGTNYEVLLGDLPTQSGVLARLMQMYLGVPWVSTLAAARTALQAVELAAKSSSRRYEQSEQKSKARIDSIRNELGLKRAELEAMPSDEAIRNAIDSDAKLLLSTQRLEAALSERLEREVAALRFAETACIEDKRDLQSHNDAISASAVFRRLKPKCCPRCDHTISKAKVEREHKDFACSVCGESISNSEDAEELSVELEERVIASQDALKRAKKLRNETEVLLQNQRDKIQEIRLRIEVNTQNIVSYAKRQELVTMVAVLEGRLEEASLAKDPPDDGHSTEIKILTAVVNETEIRVKDIRDGLLEDVSKRLVHYAKAFGMENLSDASLKGNGNLSLTKAGAATSYSRVTEGEKLRLKVATVLAMIEIAEKQGIGRHPGLLMIDSPAAQEVSPEDVDHLVAGLQEVSGKLSHLQVFIAGITSKAITDHIPESHRQQASGSAFLW